MSVLSSLTSLVIALIAVIISIYALNVSRRQDRRDMFLKLHEKMIDPEIHAGRRYLLEHINSETDAVALRRKDEIAYFSINRSIAMLDVVALYVKKNFVAKDLILEEWGEVYRQCYIHARYYIAVRQKELTFSFPLWPHFTWLAKEALDQAQLMEPDLKPTALE
jgi:hypothetical protein